MIRTAASRAAAALAIAMFAPPRAGGQDGRAAPEVARPVVFSTREDHRDMLDRLGIARLRPGKNSSASGPDPANYDEAKANPHPTLPPPLEAANGTRIDTPARWWAERRPEIVEALEREVYGRIPADVPAVRWEVLETVKIEVGGRPAVRRRVVGVVDDPTCPEIRVEIALGLTLPERLDGPVPVLLSFGRMPTGPTPPAAEGRGGARSPSKEETLLAAGWGCATLDPTTVQDDAGGWQPRRPGTVGVAPEPEARPTGAGLTRGIIGLANRGRPRRPDQWGALRAWAWGASRGLDYLATVPEVDAKRVGIAGVSRYGKAALVTLAFDQRFAAGLIASSGKGGAVPFRRDFGEGVENLTGQGEYHWMAGNFLRYGADLPESARRSIADLPVDSHLTLALCAPGLTFLSAGVPERGDAPWLDNPGSFMASIAAQPVFRLLGARDLGRSDDYAAERMPGVNVGLLDGALAWRQHDGGHTDGPNVEHFVRWAEARWRDSPARPGPVPDHAAIERRDANSREAHRQLVAKAKQGKIDLYFVGDSLTRRWGATDYPHLLAHWNRQFHGWNAANFGWGGDTTHNILWRLRNGELDGLSPRVVVLLAGTNNLRSGPADDSAVADVVGGIEAILAAIRTRAPDATIILTGLFPRPQKPELAPALARINAHLTRLADGRTVRFLDISDRLADASGAFRPGFSRDGLHIEEPGYDVWADALRPHLSELLGPPAPIDQAPPPTGDPAANRPRPDAARPPATP